MERTGGGSAGQTPTVHVSGGWWPEGAEGPQREFLLRQVGGEDDGFLLETHGDIALAPRQPAARALHPRSAGRRHGR